MLDQLISLVIGHKGVVIFWALRTFFRSIFTSISMAAMTPSAEYFAHIIFIETGLDQG